MRWIILIALLLMSSCASTSFNTGATAPAAASPGPALPPAPKIRLFHYSDAFQDRLLIESRTLLPPCDRAEPVMPCSALDRVYLDSLFNRNQMRTLGVRETP